MRKIIFCSVLTACLVVSQLSVADEVDGYTGAPNLKSGAAAEETPDNEKTYTEIARDIAKGGLFKLEYNGKTYSDENMPSPMSVVNKTARYDEYGYPYFYDDNGVPYFYSATHGQSFYYKEGKGPASIVTPEQYKEEWAKAIEDKIAEEKTTQAKAKADAEEAAKIAESKLRRKIRAQERRKAKAAASQLENIVSDIVD